MNEQSASPGHFRPTRTWSPHGFPDQPITVLVASWSKVRTRALLARNAGSEQPDAEDLFAELAYGARIVQEVISGRWCVVAELLRNDVASFGNALLQHPGRRG